MRRLSMLLVVLLAAPSLLATSIKKSDGQTVEGTLQGEVIQKGEVKKSKSEKDPNSFEYIVIYTVTQGADVVRIDENGLVIGTNVIDFIMVSQEGAPPEDDDLGKEKPGRTALRTRARSRYSQRTETDPLIGELRLDPATSKKRLFKSLEVHTANGVVKIPVAEVVAFRGKAAAKPDSK